jgi:protein O-mannosyl-transferase
VDKAIRKYQLSCIYILLSLVTIVSFEQVRNFDFINFDDQVYVTHNQYVRTGLTRDSIIWAFTDSGRIFWHPLTWLSHMLDCQLFGLNAGRHHVVNLLLHLANTLLLFNVLMQMTKAPWRSFFVAGAFALHPMHVESVAWVAERKDVLSTLFWMLTMIAYLRYAKRPVISRYLLTLILFILGLMAKPILVTLPFVLLLLDYWPLERMRITKRRENIGLDDTNTNNTVQKPIGYLLLEKVPFLMFSAVFSIITFTDKGKFGALSVVENLSLSKQIGNAIVSYVVYIDKMIWPSRLAILYLHPGNTLSMVKFILSGALLLLISFSVYIARKRKYLTVGWLWYLGVFVPVIGFVQTGGQAWADRYSYIPFIGLFIIVAWGANELFAKWRYRKITSAVLAGAILLACAICTRFQVRYWRNNTTVFEHAIKVTENNYVAYCTLAELLLQEGKIQQAIEYFTEALRAKPDFIGALNNLGYALAKQGKYYEAERYYRQALQIKPDFVEAHSNLAHALAHQGKFDEAILHWTEMIRLDPNNPTTHTNIAVVLTRQGKFDEAIKHLTEALRIDPNNIKAKEDLRLALSAQDNSESEL